jgi:A/G-specific adenine glycosylase
MLEKNVLEQLQTAKIEWFRSKLRAWAKLHFRDFPWRRVSDPYAIFIAEFLLQKTVAETVAPIYEIFLSRYPTIEALGKASIAELGELLKPLGLAFRTERMSQSAKSILEEYGGNIPDSEMQLLDLPGVGKYTARSICANAFDRPKAILDTNVARILERFFGLQGNRVKSRCKILWSAAERVAPDKDVGRWNLTLLDFGALVCTARNPHCGECPLQKQCLYAKNLLGAR